MKTNLVLDEPPLPCASFPSEDESALGKEGDVSLWLALEWLALECLEFLMVSPLALAGAALFRQDV